MRLFATLFMVLLSSSALSADWKKLDGIYAVTSEGYLDPTENEQKYSHYRFQLKGKSAEDLYLAMKSKPIVDECTGGLAKNIGDMQCLFYKSSGSYECHFSINIAKQEIEYGVVC
ncbi:hypothetical protein ACFL2V_03225 [Pseudomonadota bacterium]